MKRRERDRNKDVSGNKKVVLRKEKYALKSEKVKYFETNLNDITSATP